MDADKENETPGSETKGNVLFTVITAAKVWAFELLLKTPNYIKWETVYTWTFSGFLSLENPNIL